MDPFIDSRGLFSLSDTTLRPGANTEHIPGHIRRAISHLNLELLDALRHSAQRGAVLPVPEECRGALAELTTAHQGAVANCGLVLVDVERSIAVHPDGAGAVQPMHDHVSPSWLEPDATQSLIQSVWMVSWYLCQWNERVARVLLDLPAQLTQQIARSAPRDWAQLSRAPSSNPTPRWQRNALMWRTLLSSGPQISMNAHQRLVGRGLQLSAGALLARSAEFTGVGKARHSL